MAITTAAKTIIVDFIALSSGFALDRLLALGGMPM